MTDNLAISCHGLKKHYPDVKAVDGLDLEVLRGECFGLLGPNGAGKTTTIEILEGLNTPDAGDVRILGLSWNDSEREIRERIGVSLQETQFSEKITVYETLVLFRSFYRSGPARAVSEPARRATRPKAGASGVAAGCPAIRSPPRCCVTLAQRRGSSDRGGSAARPRRRGVAEGVRELHRRGGRHLQCPDLGRARRQ